VGLAVLALWLDPVERNQPHGVGRGSVFVVSVRIVFPNPGIQRRGENLEELRRNVKETVVFHLDDLCFDAGSFYVMDRGYLGVTRLRRIHRHSAFF
jgi:hypothetical protein